LRLARVLGALVLLLTLVTLPGVSDPDALLLLQSGRADQALKLLNSQVESNPNDARAYNLMCRVYFQLEHWDEAIRAAERSVELAPDSSEYHQWLGRIYGEKAETIGKVHFVSAISLVRKVKAEFERAVALDGDGKNLSARADLAEFYTEAPAIMGGDKGKARTLAEFLMKRDPALAHYILARLEEKQNAKDRAEQEYKAAIEASNNLARYWISLGSFYRRTGRLNEMQASVTRSLTAHREQGIALFDGASLLLNAGRDFPEAVKMFREYLSLNDPAEDGPAFQAHYLLGMLLEKQGDAKAAAAEYRAALALASEYLPAQEALARLTK
jgi:tetratricopeptide (TPR) repeat protein